MAIRPYGQYLVADTEAELIAMTPLAGQIGYPMDTKIRLIYNGTVWGPNSAVQILRGVGTIDGKVATATLNYTMPNTTFRFVPLGAHIETLSITGTVGIAPAVSVGTNSTAYNNLFTTTVLNSLLTGSGLTQTNALTEASAIAPLTSGAQIYVKVNTTATLFTTYTFRVDILGYYEV